MGKKTVLLPHDFQSPVNTCSKTGIGGRRTYVPSITVSNDQIAEETKFRTLELLPQRH